MIASRAFCTFFAIMMFCSTTAILGAYADDRNLHQLNEGISHIQIIDLKYGVNSVEFWGGAESAPLRIGNTSVFHETGIIVRASVKFNDHLKSNVYFLAAGGTTASVGIWHDYPFSLDEGYTHFFRDISSSPGGPEARVSFFNGELDNHAETFAVTAEQPPGITGDDPADYAPGNVLVKLYKLSMEFQTSDPNEVAGYQWELLQSYTTTDKTDSVDCVLFTQFAIPMETSDKCRYKK